MTNPGDDSPVPSARADRPGLFDRLRALLGINGASVREDIEDALEDSSTGAEFTPQERVILKNVLSLHELRVEDVMIPRADIIAVELKTNLHGVLELFRTAGHSRLPVYSETLDDPRGMVHIRDFVDYVARAAESVPMSLQSGRQGSEKSGLARFADATGLDLTLPLSEADIQRPVLFAPPSMPVLDLLVRMQATHTHMALVIDEYGGTDGLVSIEDIVEMIVGNIEDEHDLDESPKIEKVADDSFVMDARASLEDVADAIGGDVGGSVDREEVDTIGGLVTVVAGRLPARGEIIRLDDSFEAEVMDADPRRLKRLRVRRRRPQTPGTAAPDPQ
jgi:CBS domain containing-hemolysin-like protein